MRSDEHERGINDLCGALSLAKATVVGIESALHVMESLSSESKINAVDDQAPCEKCIAIKKPFGDIKHCFNCGRKF